MADHDRVADELFQLLGDRGKSRRCGNHRLRDAMHRNSGFRYGPTRINETLERLSRIECAAGQAQAPDLDEAGLTSVQIGRLRIQDNGVKGNERR